MKKSCLLLMFGILTYSLSAQVPTIPDVKGTSDEPGNTRSAYQKAMNQRNYAQSGFLSGSFSIEADRFGVSGVYESARKFQKSWFLTGRAVYGSHSYYSSIFTSNFGLEAGLLKILYNFEDYDGENSIYTRFNSGPFLGFNRLRVSYNPTIRNSTNGASFQDAVNFTEMGSASFGFHTNLKLGYVITVWKEYSFQAELGGSHVGFVNNGMSERNFFSPEFSIGVKKSNMFEW